MDGRQLPDMGTMTARLSWEDAWLFADTPAGAEASARLSAKANGLEPYTYLRRVLEELPVAIAANDDAAITQLLPWNVTATDA